MKVEMIEGAWSKWSVKAGAALTVFWAAVAGAWVMIDQPTQQAILDDFGIGMMSMEKLVAYGALVTAASNGLVLALRVLRQPDPQ